MDRNALAHQALTEALRVRQELRKQLWEPVSIYDLISEAGIEIRFADIPSMEGMYSKSPGPLIVINSERPAGRQVFTAAHEFGHHVFGHGTRVDLLIQGKDRDDASSPGEFLATLFAGFLLMPKLGVQRLFAIRKWTPTTATPVQVFTLAGALGVGYTTLINHMQRSLKLLPWKQAELLRKATPKQIREEVLGQEREGDLFIADEHWNSRPIDLQIGDFLLVHGTAELDGSCLQSVEGSIQRGLFRAAAQGIGRVIRPHIRWSSFVRVSKRNYVGRSKYRYMEEVEE